MYAKIWCSPRDTIVLWKQIPFSPQSVRIARTNNKDIKCKKSTSIFLQLVDMTHQILLSFTQLLVIIVNTLHINAHIKIYQSELDPDTMQTWQLLSDRPHSNMRITDSHIKTLNTYNHLNPRNNHVTKSHTT